MPTATTPDTDILAGLDFEPEINERCSAYKHEEDPAHHADGNEQWVLLKCPYCGNSPGRVVRCGKFVAGALTGRIRFDCGDCNRNGIPGMDVMTILGPAGRGQ